MDRRLIGYLGAAVSQRPPAWADGLGIERGDALVAETGPAAPVDTDVDGIPDQWEQEHGLDPRVANMGTSALAAAGTETCLPGYADLECYLNELAELLVAGRSGAL